MEKLFGTHKDQAPEDTIKTIRDILTQIDIFPYETIWNNVSKNIYSLRLEDHNFPVGTNGKGASPLYALASAYGEFMERLQNQFLYQRQFGLMPSDKSRDIDGMSVQARSFYKEHEHIIKSLIDEGVSPDDFISFTGNNIRVAPFFSVKENKAEYLPLELILEVTGSNGMCAGNTPEEAILQGICEILERMAINEAFKAGNGFPTIPLEEIRHLDVYGMLEQLMEDGFRFIIKDCTIGGRFPVIAVIIINRSRNGYRANFASDPILETALQRCITELCQGKDTQRLQIQMQKIGASENTTYFSSSAETKQHEKEKFISNGSGKLPDKILFSDGIPQHTTAFQQKFSSHAVSLQFVVNILLKNRYDIYIRDVSFLGFPSYYVYIPGMSESIKLNKQSLAFGYEKHHFLRKTL
jgi:ribosomal protein S12 methylthiotransferase accessory factor